MSAKNKLKQFAETKTFPNFFEITYNEAIKGFALKGNWAKDFFKNNNPITLELGCGKGEYTIALAKKYPNKNYIGVDIKGARIWQGCKTSIDENMKNVAFLRINIELINYFFAQKEVSELWITHPDPQPRLSKAKKRLTSPQFLNRYMNILTTNNLIHLKTDNYPLFKYTLSVISANNHKLHYKTFDLYSNEQINDDSDKSRQIGTSSEQVVLITQTFYEKMFLKEGNKINYLRFSHNMALSEVK